MQAQATLGVWEFVVFWIFTGSGLLGLPPGDRDPLLPKSAPTQSLAYFEWASQGKGQSGVAGVDGFVADPEIRQFFDLLDAALAKRDVSHDEEPLHELRSELPRLIKLIAAHPGCLFIGFEPKPQNKPGIDNWFNALLGVQGGVILSVGDDIDATWKSLHRCLAAVPDYIPDDTAQTQSIPLPFPGYQLVMHREGPRIIFAWGDGSLKRITNGLKGQSSGLESNPRFRKAFERVAIPRVSTVGWMDCHGIFDSTSAALGPLGGLVKPLLMMIGADSLDHLIQVSGVDKDAMIQRTFVATGGRTDGVMVVAAGQPIQPHHFSHVPVDADLVVATSISLAKIYREARQLLVKVQPLSVKFFDEAIKQLETELELKIADDILPAFDDVVTAFNSPAAGGMIATSLVVSLEVKNYEKAALVFNRLMKLAEQSLTSDQSDAYDSSITFRHQQFLGHTIYYVNSAGAGYGVSVSTTPSFCLTDRHLLFAIHPQAMKAQLRHLASRQPGFDQHANRKVSLPAGDVLTYAYLNGPRANGIAGTILPYLGHTFLNRLEFEGVSMDSFSIPSAAAIAPYFGDSTAAVTRQKDGLFIETRNAPPVIVSLALLSAYRAWNATDFEYLEVSRQRKANGLRVVRREPVGTKPAPAAADSKDGAQLTAKANPSPYRKLAPLFLKAMIPEDIQPLIPESAYRKLEEGPSATTLQRREEARRKREELRKKQLEKKP